MPSGPSLAADGNQITRRRGEAALPPTNTAFDALAQANEAQHEAWLVDPLLGRPVFTPPTDATPELIREQGQMLVVLKLQRRVQVAGETRTGVKVVTFDKGKRAAVATSPKTSRPADVSDLVRRIGDLRQLPLATIDADGSLLLTSDRGRMQQLLGFDGRRYRTEQSGQRAVTATDLPDSKLLHGWLEENPENPSRPLAKFAIVDRHIKR